MVEVVCSQRHKATRRQFVNSIAAFLLCVNLIIAFTANEWTAQFTSLLVALVVFALGHTSNVTFSPKLRHFALCGALISTLLLVNNLITLMAINDWVVIGLGGGALLVGASLFERSKLRHATD
jgi:hypothetical protein